MPWNTDRRLQSTRFPPTPARIEAVETAIAHLARGHDEDTLIRVAIATAAASWRRPQAG